MNKLPTIDIKGKEYVMVKDRIIHFNNTYKNGSIRSKIISYDDGHVVVIAKVIPDVESIERHFVGHSQASDGEGMMGNVALEVAETSAIGRALAMMGIGVIDSIASADEMNKA